MTENPLSFGANVGDDQVITRAGQVEAVVVPLEEYRALEALEQHEAELYWAVHEAKYPSRPGDDVPKDKAHDSIEFATGSHRRVRVPISLAPQSV